MKKLQLKFNTEGKGTFSMTIASPKEGLDKAAVEAAAAKLQPVLESTKGLPMIGFDKAVIITTTEEELQ